MGAMDAQDGFEGNSKENVEDWERPCFCAHETEFSDVFRILGKKPASPPNLTSPNLVAGWVSHWISIIPIKPVSVTAYYYTEHQLTRFLGIVEARPKYPENYGNTRNLAGL